MPSPFPGMDPYIESWIWEDFHARLVPALYDQLTARLPNEYDASTELFVWRVEESGQEWTLIGDPDIYVTEATPAAGGVATATASAPFVSRLPGIVHRQKHIKIIDKNSRRILTVIECLSPANKTRGNDGQVYRLKREEYLASGINLVEIDLLRGGMRPPLGDPPPQVTDYYVLVSRSQEPSRLETWPFGIREPIPLVHVPLEPSVPDVMIDLRKCVDHVYDSGRYYRRLEYDKPPRPPLREPDAAWARDLLAAHRQKNGTGD